MSSAEAQPILPVVDEDSAPFWEACREHRLVAQRCGSCSAFRFPPSPICDRCRSWAAQWEELPPTGRLYSWVVAHHYVHPGFADVPYVIGLVEYEPMVRVPGRLRDVAPESCRSDMAMRVVFRDVTPEISLPEFVPAGREEG